MKRIKTKMPKIKKHLFKMTQTLMKIRSKKSWHLNINYEPESFKMEFSTIQN